TLTKDIYAGFLRVAAVIFVARERPTVGQSLDSLLDNFLGNTILDTILRAAGVGPHLVKRTGGLAILTLTDVREAFDLACKLRPLFLQSNMVVRIGIDYGGLLLFERGGGQNDLAGDCVNIASKISEDAVEGGLIRISSRAAGLLPAESLTGARP